MVEVCSSQTDRLTINLQIYIFVYLLWLHVNIQGGLLMQHLYDSRND